MNSTVPLAMSAVIPAYNEAGRIHQTVSLVWKYASEVIVIDDGSADGTAYEADVAGARAPVIKLCQSLFEGYKF